MQYFQFLIANLLIKSDEKYKKYICSNPQEKNTRLGYFGPTG